jgi:hypothetical protein
MPQQNAPCLLRDRRKGEEEFGRQICHGCGAPENSDNLLPDPYFAKVMGCKAR